MHIFAPSSAVAWIEVPFWGIAAKSTLALALAMLACKLLWRASAAMRHRVWVFGLAAALILPPGAVLLPKFNVAVLPDAWNRSELTSTEDPSVPAPRSFRPRFAGELAGNSGALSHDLDQQAGHFAASRSTRNVQPADELSAAQSSILGIGQVCVLVWLLGLMIGLMRLVIVLARQSVALGRLRSVDDHDWVQSVSVAARAIALDRTIVTLEAEAACVPAVVGMLRPRLIVPSHWRTWSPAQRHCILLHELAHVKRHDVVTQLLGRLALIVHWFNPLVWHAVRQLRVERELASDDCVLLAGQAASEYAEQLVQTLRCYRVVRPALGAGMAQSARLDQRVLAILDPGRHRAPLGSRSTIVLTCIMGVMVGALSGMTLTTSAPMAHAAENAGPVWKEHSAIEFPGSLPVSVAFSADGKTLLTGDTSGEVMALIFENHEPRWRWKAKVGGSHAAVAFSADQKQAYATTKNGVRILDAGSGKEDARIEEETSNPIVVAAFPDRTIAEGFIRSQLAFGTPRGYFVESWAKGKVADTISTIQTSTAAKDAQPADEAAVPLAVDPKGRCAIMTGPIDATGEASGAKGKNVLWAYVCGDYEEGSPGNRVMPGHTATVVSAAWAKEGTTAVTGDAAGRVIVWDATKMKETQRLEVGGRVAALAISDDGKRTAAYVFGKQAEVYMWETSQPKETLKSIHTEIGDFGGPQVSASLSFGPDGRQLAGCAIDRKWLNRLGELVGKVRVWELSPAPKVQLPPKQSWIKPLPKGSSSEFVILDNGSMLVPAEQGAVDFRRVADGEIQARITMGKFSVGGIKLSTDRKWLALEQHPTREQPVPGATFDVGVYNAVLQPKLTVSSCSQLLDIASGGRLVAVVRERQLQLWATETAKKIKDAPFQHTQIDAAGFSPDGRLLAIADRQELVLWQWEQGTLERIDLGRDVRSLAFSPNGRFLAVGPQSDESIRILSVESRQIMQKLAIGAKESANVSCLAWSQGGRVLIACARPIQSPPGSPSASAPNHINFWDMSDDSLAHQLMTPGLLPENFDVSPNGRTLVATLGDSRGGIKLSGWRLDGESPEKPLTPPAPATRQPE